MKSSLLALRSTNAAKERSHSHSHSPTLTHTPSLTHIHSLPLSLTPFLTHSLIESRPQCRLVSFGSLSHSRSLAFAHTFCRCGSGFVFTLSTSQTPDTLIFEVVRRRSCFRVRVPRDTGQDVGVEGGTFAKDRCCHWLA